jgi:peptidoglycan/xylan/chitin deacetylase (PgdA/CDA1 family)
LKKITQYLYKFRHPIQGEIWCLHRVKREKSIFPENRELEISPDFFESLIMQYQSAGYQFTSLDDIVLSKLHRYRYPWQSKFIHITFDDGFEDIYQNAFPILKKYDIPFTIYLSTDIIDNQAILWWLALERIILTNDTIYLSDNTTYYCQTELTKQETFTILSQAIFSSHETPSVAFQRLFSHYQVHFETGKNHALSNFEIKEMIDSGLCTIGAHAVSHPVLTKLNPKQCSDEIYHSKKSLEERWDISVDHFSYPYSFWNLQVEALIKQAGFRTAVLGYGGSCRFKAVNLFKLHRVYVTESY